MTVKQSWWAGYRAGKGLPADTPRQEALAARAAELKNVQPAEPVNHDLYKTGDPDAPEQILDRNGVVVLQCCKRCGKAEAELSGPCEPVKVDAEASVPSDSEIMWEWANTKNTGDMRIDLVAFARALLARYRNT